MNKKEIINTLSKYNFDKNKFCIISGAALVLLGFIENTKDIDIAVTEDYYNWLIRDYNCIFERTNEFNKDCYIIDNVINFGVSFMPNEFEIINGYKVASLESCYKLKLFLNRPKDKKIIKKLQQILK